MKGTARFVTKKSFLGSTLQDNCAARSLVRIVANFWNSEPAAFANPARLRVLAGDASK